MSKLTKVMIICLGLFCCINFWAIPIKADMIPGTNYEKISNHVLYDKSTNEIYEFQTGEMLNIFLENTNNISMRSYDFSERRTVVNRTYDTFNTSGHLISTIYGGAHGGTMTLSHGVSVNAEGITSSITTGMSYTVPKYKRGNIVLKTRLRNTEYRWEIRYRNGSTYTPWRYAGIAYTHKKVISNWYAPVYW